MSKIKLCLFKRLCRRIIEEQGRDEYQQAWPRNRGALRTEKGLYYESAAVFKKTKFVSKMYINGFTSIRQLVFQNIIKTMAIFALFRRLKSHKNADKTMLEEKNSPTALSLDDMPRFEESDHFLEIMSTSTTRKHSQFRSCLWFKGRRSKVATLFDTHTYTMDLTLTRFVTMTWPKAIIGEKSQVPASGKHHHRKGSLGFLYRVQHLKLNVIVDQNYLSNKEKIKQIERDLQPFRSLKNIKATIRVNSIARAMEDETYQDICLFFWTYGYKHGCNVKVHWEKSEETRFPPIFSESMMIGVVMAAQLGPTKTEDIEKARLHPSVGRTVVESTHMGMSKPCLGQSGVLEC